MADKGYTLPYTITDEILNLVSDITEILTKLTIDDKMNYNPRFRRDNRVKTIHASLAIENNSLSIEQVTDIIAGKRVLGPQNEICEVKNAFEAYEHLLELNPYLIKDMLKAHKMLMHDLTKEAGTFRQGGVGVFAGDRLVHMAPPAERVPQLIKELIDWLKNDKVHPLIKSCVFHYEFEFIHPFADGNGRMWHTLILYKWKPIFGWLPIETIIRERQEEYYNALGKADSKADSGVFIEFLLQAIYNSLKEYDKTEQVTVQVTEQVERLLDVIGDDIVSSKELM